MSNDFMNEFGGEENLDALNVLIDEVTDGEAQPEEVPETEAPILEPEVQENITPEEVEPGITKELEAEIDPSAPPQPQMSPETQAILAQMQEQNDNIADIQKQIKNQPKGVEPELSEEEEAMVELKKRLGFDKIEEQNAQLQQQIDKQNEILAMQKEEAYQSAVRGDIDALKIEYKGFDESLVAKELDALSKVPVMLPNGQIARDEKGNPINQAMLNDNKEGWGRIWKDKFAQTEAPTPDPIVPATAGNTAPTKSAIERIKESNDNVSTGEALLDLIGG